MLCSDFAQARIKFQECSYFFLCGCVGKFKEEFLMAERGIENFNCYVAEHYWIFVMQNSEKSQMLMNLDVATDILVILGT